MSLNQDQPTQLQPLGKAPGSVNRGEDEMKKNPISPNNNPKNIVWGPTSEELGNRHASTFTTLKLMLSGVEAPRQVVNGSPVSLSEEHEDKFQEPHRLLVAKAKKSPFARSDDAPRAVPEGIDMNSKSGHRQSADHANPSSVPPKAENWDLSGNKKNMFTSEEWNNFQANKVGSIQDKQIPMGHTDEKSAREE